MKITYLYTVEQKKWTKYVIMVNCYANENLVNWIPYTTLRIIKTAT